MYSRRLGDQTYTFEPSGGLLNASLVMMDRETDSHWSILTEESVWGPAKGTRMETLPGTVKVTWGEWRAAHPDTLILSLDDKEHEPENPYVKYFESEDGFRKLKATDSRMADKELIYAFYWQDDPFAVAHDNVQGGGVFELGDRQLFLFRTADDPGYRSTSAFLGELGTSFVEKNGGWETAPGGLRWNPETRSFDGAAVGIFHGFDTFWYTWSLTNSETRVLDKG